MSGSSQSSKCGCCTKCGCASKGGCQSGCGCGCQSCHCHQEKYADQLLRLADDAWMEILKEKIKEEIRLNGGEQLTQLAKLVSTANHARWKDKMQGKKDHEDFECQLKNALIGGSCSPKK
jgi:hypothetical protein